MPDDFVSQPGHRPARRERAAAAAHVHLPVMKTSLPTRRSSGRSLATIITPLALALALILPGCVTRRQVSDIVAQSNAALLAGQFDLPTAVDTAAPPVWQRESDRIDAFIAAYPDQSTTTAPLRVRQAMLLLGHRQISLAQAAFNQVQIGDLHTDRDQALKRSERTLIWWFACSTNDTWTATDWAESAAALQQLRQEQATLAASPDIRDYLAEMRAWIGLSAARQSASGARARAFIQDALDVYAGIFTAADLAALAAGQERLPDLKALGSDIRRRLRVKAVLNEAQQLNARLTQANEAAAHPQTREFDQWINR
jgi:hypothetical protein